MDPRLTPVVPENVLVMFILGEAGDYQSHWRFQKPVGERLGAASIQCAALGERAVLLSTSQVSPAYE
jgi:hypothetical protein